MQKKKYFFLILTYLILFLWILIALGRTGYNLSKLYGEEKQWLFLSDDEKRKKIFGILYENLQFVDRNTRRNSFIISYYKSDIKAYYFGKYILYPRKFINFVNIAQFKKAVKTYKPDHVFVESEKAQENLIFKDFLIKNYYLLEHSSKINTKEYDFYVKT